MIESLSGRLIEWIKIETSVTPAYKTVCNYLQNIVQDFINQQRFAETIPLLNISNDINSGTLEKNDTIREVCAQLIRNLATQENITLLFTEFNTNEHDKKDEAGKILSRFGDITLKHMLDNLQEDIDNNERVRIMHLIIGTGQRAIPLYWNVSIKTHSGIICGIWPIYWDKLAMKKVPERFSRFCVMKTSGYGMKL